MLELDSDDDSLWAGDNVPLSEADTDSVAVLVGVAETDADNV